MYMRSFFPKRFILLSFVICFLLFIGAIKIYQPSILHYDGSGSFKLTYLTSDSNIANTMVLGNYAFTEDEAENNFTSENTEVKSVTIFNDKENAMTHVVLEIDFKDINKISEAKGFSDINASWTKSSKGMVFKWVILKNQLQNNLMGDLIYIFNFDGEILSSNGLVKGDSVTWFMTPTTADYTNDIILTAEVKKKSCGPFGIELPIIVTGLTYILFKRRRHLR